MGHSLSSSDGRPRVPCPMCGAMVVQGARKCRACRGWMVEGARSSTGRPRRSLMLLGAAVTAVAAVLIAQRTPVGEAPPLTALSTASASAAASAAPLPAGETPSAASSAPVPPADTKAWKTRTLRLEAHPLDVVFAPDGRTLYVSADDSTVRQFDVASGRLMRRVNVAIQGERLRLLHGRYLALIRQYSLHVPIVDTQHMESEPMLLPVGAGPTDIVALADGHTAVAASTVAKRLGWFDLATGAHLGDIKLAHETESLFLVAADGRSFIGAMGVMQRGGRPVGAWLDLFDPAETPFGATRRSIKVGRDPRAGSVSADRSSILFADAATNQLNLLRVDAATAMRSADVDQGPVGAFLLEGDRFGVTINAEARTATVVDLESMKRVRSLMLNGTPNSTATSPDGRLLLVSLGGTSWPPVGQGLVVIAGDPPAIEAALDTDRGASNIAIAPDSRHAAVANYYDRSLTLLER
ncbi:MAG: hypothetical protein IT373_31285 [Polyangiaceae bacterium]|nr:hypothetical protein [Polyangiaceae bacterium]